MASISIEQPPFSLDQDTKEYLARMFINVNIALGQSNVFTPTYILPNKPQDGQVVYFKIAILPDIPTIGLYFNNGGVWEKLSP